MKATDASLERRVEELESAREQSERRIDAIYICCQCREGPLHPLSIYRDLRDTITSSELWHEILAEAETNFGSPDPFAQHERELRAARPRGTLIVHWPENREGEGYRFIACLLDSFKSHGIEPPTVPASELEKIVRAAAGEDQK